MMAHKWVRLSTYLQRAYPDGDAPDPRTMRGAIDRQEIVGKRSKGKTGHYYVLIDTATGIEVRTTDAHHCGNPIAQRIIQKALTR